MKIWETERVMSSTKCGGGEEHKSSNKAVRLSALISHLHVKKN